MLKLLCFLGIHRYKWGALQDVKFQLASNWDGRDVGTPFIRVCQDGTCELCGKVYRRWVD